MFTGIIERTGKVVSLTASQAAITQLIIDVGAAFETALGDSVAVNGCCLTVTSNERERLAFDLSSETLSKTSLSQLRADSEVNLERAMKLGDRLGGHLVSGHVDGLGVVESISKLAQGWDLKLRLGPDLARYAIAKGSICLDGVSLTVNSVADDSAGALIGLMLIPTTVNITGFKSVAAGQKLNVEVDQVGKWVERFSRF